MIIDPGGLNTNYLFVCLRLWAGFSYLIYPKIIALTGSRSIESSRAVTVLNPEPRLGKLADPAGRWFLIAGLRTDTGPYLMISLTLYSLI